MNKYEKYTIGLDFGSLSCRGVLVNIQNGYIEAEASAEYAHGVMSERLPDGTPLGPDFCLQHPRDFRETMTEVVRKLTEKCADPKNIVGIAVDSTVSTVVAIGRDFVPLCERSEFSSHPHAWAKMWKHHAAAPIAKRVEDICKKQDRPYLDWYGGSISPECLFIKAIETFERDREVYDATVCFMELADYITSLLAGEAIFSIPLLRAKAFYTDGHYPDREFLYAIDDELADLPSKLSEIPRANGIWSKRILAYPGAPAGRLCCETAALLGLPVGIAISAGTADSYAPIMGIGIKDPGQMIMTIGTSTGIMIMSDENKKVAGVTASLPDIYYAGKHCYASGQTSTGDALGWFARNCVPARYEHKAEERGISVQTLLTEKAATLPAGSGGIMALDWFGGNKSYLSNPYLSGLFIGLTLSTRPEQMYRALIEATAFGAKAIIDNYENSGVPVREIRAAGGIVGKNPLLMQIYADVIGMPIKASLCNQVPALGAAINAACAAGIYPDYTSALDTMACKDFIIYKPCPEQNQKYNLLYREYLTLHDYFGKGGNRIMEKLKEKE